MFGIGTLRVDNTYFSFIPIFHFYHLIESNWQKIDNTVEQSWNLIKVESSPIWAEIQFKQ